MTPQRWQRIKDLFEEALERAPADRTAYLRNACPDDEIYEEVVVLVAAHAEGDFLAPPDAGLPGLAPDSLAEGTLLKQRYKVEKEIGEGGFAKVFRAIDLNLYGRPVVIKVLRRGNAPDSWSKIRFDDEVRALAMIDHQSVIGVLDAGVTKEGLPYFVMQFVEGQTLRSLMVDPLPYGRIAGIVTQVAQAIGAAHKLNIVHLDIKPENVMVQSLPNGEDRVRLIDFGIARILAQAASTDSTRVVGSPSYMAPEQLLGHASAASDIFALGVMVYEMVTGARPFATRNPVELYDRQQTGRFKRPRDYRSDLPIAAEEAIIRALAFSPEDRFRMAEDFTEELAAAFTRAAAAESDRHGPEPAAPPGSHRFDLFISYASRDSGFAAHLIGELERRGWRCGDGMASSPDVVDLSGCFVLALTGDADRSLRVVEEAKAAAKAGKPVVVLSIESARPTGILEFILPHPIWIECPAVLSRAHYDRIEAALRPVVFASGELRRGNFPKQQAVPEPRAPLLTEVGAHILFSSRGKGLFRALMVGVLWPAVTCVLAILGNAADITVTLAPNGAASPRLIHFGYLYELNGAFFYLLIVPIYIYCVLQFVQQAQVALVALVSRDQLVAKQPEETEPIGGPLAIVGAANRRWLNPILFWLAFAVTVVLMAGTEYLPPKSDFKNLMFGYVQAPWISDYPTVCPGCTLQQLSLLTGRKLEALDGVPADDLRSYRIVPPYYQRRGGAVERVAFVLFMISALSLQITFGMLVIWTVVKVLFVLQLLYRAISPPKQFPLRLYLRFTDLNGMFGLEPVHRLLARVVGLIGLSVIIQVLSWWTNFLKGSKRTLAGDLFNLGGWGQFLVTNYTTLLSLMLMLYLFLLSNRTRELVGEECAQLTELGGTPHKDRKTTLEDLLRVVDGQSIWSSTRFTALFALAPVLYVASLLAFHQMSIARQVGVVWELFLRHVLGKD